MPSAWPKKPITAVKKASQYASLALAASLACALLPSSAAAEAPGGPSAALVEALKPYAAAIGDSRKLEIHDAPKTLPEMRFADIEGRPRSLSEFKGKVVLVNFWATFCAPCLEEMPSLNALQAELGGEDFEVVAISLDAASPKRPLDWLEKHEIDKLAFYHDKAWDAARASGAVGLPTTLLLDRDGLEVGRLVGAAEWHSESALDAIRLLINGGPEAG